MNGPSGCLCAIAADEIARLNTALATSEAKLEKAREALGMIDNWAKAYPLSVFPEPDFANARKLLEAGGMTLDAISASNMRHVVEGVASIAATTLKDIT
jgi:hypothetical protein